ncbi:FxsA family protein [Calidifontibacter sp. DB0510]|uniref:FxsA family protein n=1 Tax=Metallococcus carri TaxID=1656884 RepID=A0A967B533_9MICO|nr:FxsA family protein [Metallococcus carri]NOP37136.1 FxsA family protein [Calidifontibacter sp. DB2511S]
MVAPIVEIAVIVAVGRTIGGWQTFGLLLIWSLIGAWLVRREWGHAWGALSTALRTGAMPARELSDAALVLVGGVLLLTPGFVTDLFGLFLLLPFTRPVSRGILQAAVARRVLAGAGPAFPGGMPYAGPGADPRSGRPQRSPASDDVIEGEIVDED